jgi:DNA primase
VDPQRQRWKCYGCNLSGDVFDFIQRRHNTDFMGALRILGMDGEQLKPDPTETRR